MKCFSNSPGFRVTASPLRMAALILTLGAATLYISGTPYPAAAQESGKKSKAGAEAKKDASKKGADQGKRRRGRRGPASIEVDAVRKGVEAETSLVYGRIIARQAGVVAARTRGAVGEIHVQVGDRVTKGQLLVSLITSMLDAERQLKAAELSEFLASIDRAESQLKLARQELKRLQRLRNSAAFSVARYNDKIRDVERARSAVAEAKAKSDQARAELQMADINLANAQVLAPFDGVITTKHVEIGNYVNVGANVMSIVNDRALQVEAEVPANRISGLLPGVEVEVLPEHGLPFKAKVRAVVPEENPLSRTRIVRFEPLLGPEHKLVAANQSVQARIPSGLAREAVTVHKDAITIRRGNRVVFVVKEGEDGKKTASLRRVTLGEPFASRFEVLKGLKPGDQVVVRGNERLRPNQEVRLRSERRRGGRGGSGGEGRQGGKRSGEADEAKGRRNRGEGSGS